VHEKGSLGETQRGNITCLQVLKKKEKESSPWERHVLQVVPVAHKIKRSAKLRLNLGKIGERLGRSLGCGGGDEDNEIRVSRATFVIVPLDGALGTNSPSSQAWCTPYIRTSRP